MDGHPRSNKTTQQRMLAWGDPHFLCLNVLYHVRGVQTLVLSRVVRPAGDTNLPERERLGEGAVLQGGAPWGFSGGKIHLKLSLPIF